MKISASPADARPFRCRADLESEQDLDSRYQRLGIQSVVAAVNQCRAANDDRRDRRSGK